MLDYHLHLWPHSQRDVSYHVDQVARYCEEAARHGVSEIALTEHAHRFVDVMGIMDSFWLRRGHEPTALEMTRYFDFHARNSLEDYLTVAQAAKDQGLPVKIGLEVDYVAGKMDQLADLYAQYPFDVLIGSIHWLDTWQFDDVDGPANMTEWTTRNIDEVWAQYVAAFEELAATQTVDVMAHPDVIKVAGYTIVQPEPLWDRMAEAVAAVDVSVECSSAGWKKPIGEPYPADGLLERFVRAGVTFTTASDAHSFERVGERADDLAIRLETLGVSTLASYEGRLRVTVPLRSV